MTFNCNLAFPWTGDKNPPFWPTPTLAVLLYFLMLSGSAQADVFQIVTVQTPEADDVAAIVNKAYAQLGHSVEITKLPARRSLIEANKGRFDGELARIPGMEAIYPNLVRITEPVFVIEIALVVKKESTLAPKSWDDLAGQTIAYQNGYRILDIRTLGMERVLTTTTDSIGKMLLTGRIQVGIMLRSDALRLIEEVDGLRVIEPAIERLPLFHYVHLKHRHMVPDLEKAFGAQNQGGIGEKNRGKKP